MAQYTAEQYRAAAKKAMAAGDTAGAKRLIAAGRAAGPTDFRGEGGGAGTALEAGLIGARQGITFGFGDEINAGVRAAGDWLGGANYGESYDKRLEHERGVLAQARGENPKSSLAGEVGGAMMVPGLGASVGGVKGAAAVGGAMGAASGFGEGEGGLASRSRNAAQTGVLGAITGGALGAAGAHLRGRNTRRGIDETVDALKGTRDAGYSALDTSTAQLTDNGVTKLQGSVANRAAAADADPVLHPRATRMTTLAGQPKDRYLSSVEQRRQAIGRDVAGSADLGERRVGAEMKAGVDDFYDSLGPGDVTGATPQELADVVEALKGSRAATTKIKKHEGVVRALDTAEHRAATGGIGGNETNTMKQNIRAILDSPQKARGYSPAELQQMEKVVMGTPTSNAARRVGRLAPSSGTLSAVGQGTAAVQTGGATLPIVAITEAAKLAGEKLTRKEITRLEQMIVTGNPNASARGLTNGQRKVLRALMAGQQGLTAPARNPDDFGG